jgi:hypothetical protein
VHCDTSKDFLVEQFRLNITYVDPDIAGKRVGYNNSHQISWHWLGYDEWILLTVTSIVNTTILSIVNAGIAGLPDSSRTIPAL